MDTSFLPIAKNKIKKKQVQTLEDLNRTLQGWIEDHYHKRVHGGIDESARVRFERYPVKPLPYGKQELRRLFFLEETRKVDKTGTIALKGLAYQVPAELCGLKVQVRYDAYEPSDAEVYLNGVLAGKAELSDPVARYRRRFRKDKIVQGESDSLLAGQLVFSISGETKELECNPDGMLVSMEEVKK